MKLYLKSKDNSFNAIGNYNYLKKEFILKKGSIVNDTIAVSPSFKGGKSIKKHRQGTVINCKTINDIVFKSSSTAANFVTGRSTNGLIAWKDENGRKLKDLLNNE